MALLGTLIINVVVVSILLILFSILRRKFPSLYSYKSFEIASWAPPLTKGLFGWMSGTWQYPDSELLAQPGGFDAFSFLDFLRYTIRFFTLTSAVTLIAALWTNWSGSLKDLPSDDPRYPKGFDVWTLANIDGDQMDNRLIVHLLIVIMESLFIWLLLFKLYKNFSKTNHSRLKSETLTARSVMIANLPRGITTDGQLRERFVEEYGNRMTDCLLVKDTTALRNLANKRDEYFENWKKEKHIEAQTGVRNVVSIGMKGGQVDAIKHWERKVRKYDGLLTVALENVHLPEKQYLHSGLSPRLERKAQTNNVDNDSDIDINDNNDNNDIEDIEAAPEKKGSVLGKVGSHASSARNFLKLSPVGVGFVSFDSLAVATQAAQTLQMENPRKMVVRMAPDASDVAWNWVGKSEREVMIRFIVVMGLILVLFTFWTIPVAFISSITKLETLATVPGLDFLVTLIGLNPLVKSILEGFLPSLALIVFMALLPVILTLILNQRAFILKSSLDQSVAITFYTFLLFNVFLVITIAGSIWGVLGAVIDDPSSLITLLSNSLPTQANFFVNYIVSVGAISLPLSLIDPGPLIISRIKIATAKTKLQKRAAENPNPFKYKVIFAQVLLVFTIGLVYSTMAPFINAYCLLYFSLAFLAHKHNLVFKNMPEYNGLVFTPIAVDIVTVATVLYQLTMTGVFGLKSFAAGAIVCAVFAGLTILFRLYLSSRWDRASTYLPLQDCPRTSDEDKLLRHETDDMHAVFVDPAAKPRTPMDVEKEAIVAELDLLRKEADKKKRQDQLKH